MNSLRRFEYWPELVLVLIMLIVLVLDFTLFEGLWSSGEDGGQVATTIQGTSLF